MILRRLMILLGAVAVVLAGCTVPREREVGRIDKPAISDAKVESVYLRYRQVRNAAIELLDPKPLSTIETGPVLAIDTGSFEVSQRLNTTQKQASGDVDIVDVQTPRFAKYPLWYLAVVNDEGRDVQRVQIFERATAVDPWLLVATPEALADTALPEIRTTGGGAARKVPAADDTGMAMSPQQAASAYARTLADPEGAVTATVADDSFIQQMRDASTTNGALDGVRYRQAWRAQPVKYALRTADGGALAFVTLERTDTYTVGDGFKVTWPEGSPQQAFLEDGIEGSGQLDYLHQVLVYLPGGTEKPRALGQFGGVVSGSAG